MAKVKTVEEEDSLKKLTAFVVKELKAGTEKATISEKLVQMGIKKQMQTRLSAPFTSRQ